MDLSLASLLGEKIYNFGELLSHPVLSSLAGTPWAWLAQLLAIFNAGDLARYDGFCDEHAAALNGQPALVAAFPQLREKLTVVALMEHLGSLPAEQRTVALADVGAATQLDADGTERLLMRALSVGLLQGVIDQVGGTVRVSWVQPRVLLAPQIAALRGRLDAWLSKVQATRLELEAASPELIGKA